MIDSIANREFLKKLDKQKNKTIFARVVALDLNDLPLQSIEGYVSQGSINIDGASAVRRTCSLTIVAREDKFKFSDNYYYWGFNTKFRLEIGVENTVDKDYPEIIWFKQGVFIITSFNSTRSTNNLTITLQGKDKMCLLNGEVGGYFEAQTKLDILTEIDKDGNTVVTKIPLATIIKNIVVHFGREKEHNVIIKDLEDYGLELLEYRGNKPLYLIRQGENNMDTFLTATYQGNTPCEVRSQFFKNGDGSVETFSATLNSIEQNEQGTTYDSISEGLLGKSNNIAEVVNFGESGDYELDNVYRVVRINYGQTVGFKTTELVFAGELTVNAGESLTSALDKIKNILGEFEYFYDIDGKFIFQQKPSVYQRSWTSAREEGAAASIDPKIEEKFIQKLEQSKVNVYKFDSSELITSFNTTPAIGNIKNDFSIWGQRAAVTGGNIPIHLRCAIDKKPERYTSILVEPDNIELLEYNQKYNLEITGQASIPFISSSHTSVATAGGIPVGVHCDWREVLFRMASDYLKYNFLSDFRERVIKANADYELYENGMTGYEQYYADIQGYWRDLYNPEYYEISKVPSYTLYDFLYKDYTPKDIDYSKKRTLFEENRINYYEPKYNIDKIAINPQFNHWSKSIVEAPETINFWFDFIDTTSELSKYSVEAIGRRTKVVNDTNIKAIFYEDTPTVIFVDDIRKYTAIGSGDYSYIQIPNEIELFSVSGRGQSAMDKLDSLLYQHTYCTENASITTLPIYYLQPNSRINIDDEILGVSGDYIATKFSLQLSHSGTMSITATKAIDNIDYY